MVLKQRFANGRTNYTEIGNSFQVETPASEGWSDTLNKRNELCKTDVVAILSYNINTGTEDKTVHEPIYKDFRQWLYSNSGQLFLTLT